MEVPPSQLGLPEYPQVSNLSPRVSTLSPVQALELEGPKVSLQVSVNQEELPTQRPRHRDPSRLIQELLL